MHRSPDLEGIKSIHFTGIKGVGMTSLACCAQDLGLKVTGTDLEEVFVTDAVLSRRRLRWRVGFDPARLGKPDLVVVTGAHGGFTNPEAIAARKKGIRCVSQAEAVGMFASGYTTLSVCGVGGKSTTSAMLATALQKAGGCPSFSIGVGQLFPLGDPGRMAAGKYFIAEADEYAVSPGTDQRPRFIFQSPEVVILTNLEHDHPDVYPSLVASKQVFRSFLNKVGRSGLALICGDSRHAHELVKEGLSVPVQSYGFCSGANWRVEDFCSQEGRTEFNVVHQGVRLPVILKVPGRFNALNATAVLAVGTHLGFPLKKIIRGLAEFGGTQRRFQKIGRYGPHWLYDDYAHHPSEIRSTLQAAKKWFPGYQLIIIFQPHTYSRTRAFLAQFAAAFDKADQVLVTEIYASAREGKEHRFSALFLAEKMRASQPCSYFVADSQAAGEKLRQLLLRPSVVMTMGAGDVYQWHEALGKIMGRPVKI